MDVINRCAVVIKPKEPYVTWANEVATSYETLESMRQSAKVLLLPDAVYEDPDSFVQAQGVALFEMELEAWTENQQIWPPLRNVEVFKAWFDLEFHALVVDFNSDPLIKEPYDYEIDFYS
jgi:hypothetical protein